MRILIILLSLIISFNGYAKDLYKVKGVTFLEEDEHVKVVVNTTAEPQYKSFSLENPPRLVVDFLNAECEVAEEIPIKKAIVYRVHSKQLRKEPVKIVRVVIELERAFTHSISTKDNQVVVLFKKEKVPVVERPSLGEEKPPIIEKPPIVEKPPIDVEEEKPKVVEKPPIVEKAPEEPIISLDLRDAEILDVLRLISHKAKVNIVPSKSVSGRVTVQLHNVPWETALYMVLRTHGFSYIIDRGIIWVGTPDELKEERITKILMLKYGVAEAMRPSLEPFLSEVGKIQVDKRTNALLLTDIPDRVRKIEEMVNKLDLRTPQVLIEARVVYVSVDVIERLGIRWSLDSAKDSDLYTKRSQEMEGEGGDIRYVDRYTRGEVDVGDFDEIRARPRGFLSFGFLVGDFNLDVALKALEEKGDLNILSSPSVIVLNNEEARIISGKSIPLKRTVVTPVGTQETIEYKDIGITLIVTPTITPDGYISMKVNPKVEDLGEEMILGYPVIKTDSVESKILVKDGDTIVIGGIIREKEDVIERKVPFLGNVPFLGRLFRYKSVGSEKSELLVFIRTSLIKQDS